MGPGEQVPVEAQTRGLVALSGDLEALQLAREHGCLRHEDTCTNAAVSGHLESVEVGAGAQMPVRRGGVHSAAFGGTWTWWSG